MAAAEAASAFYGQEPEWRVQQMAENPDRYPLFQTKAQTRDQLVASARLHGQSTEYIAMLTELINGEQEGSSYEKFDCCAGSEQQNLLMWTLTASDCLRLPCIPLAG